MDNCTLFGHNWVVRPIAGQLAEICAACGARPKED